MTKPEGKPAELLPCPFCGEKVISTFFVRDGRAVGCTDCAASLTAYQPDAEQKAITAWNRRAAQPAEPKQPVALESMGLAQAIDGLNSAEEITRICDLLRYTVPGNGKAMADRVAYIYAENKRLRFAAPPEQLEQVAQQTLPDSVVMNLREAGNMLSNIAFNLAQRGSGGKLCAGDIISMNYCREKWDEARKAWADAINTPFAAPPAAEQKQKTDD